jgi:hypothetical protein
LIEKKISEDLLCEITISPHHDSCNLALLSVDTIKTKPDLPEITKKLEKYTGLELIEVYLYEVDKLVI